MGQCYDVNLRVRFKDEKGVKDALFAKISRARQEHVIYNMQGLRMKGFDFDNIWDLLSVFFCGWGEKLRKSKEDWEWLYSIFDATYGWETVMMDAFDEIAPHLEDGSEIIIYPDAGCDHAFVKDGKAVWLS